MPTSKKERKHESGIDNLEESLFALKLLSQKSVEFRSNSCSQYILSIVVEIAGAARRSNHRRARTPEVRGHDHRQQHAARSLGRGEKAREHRPRDAHRPKHSFPRRADVGIGLDDGPADHPNTARPGEQRQDHRHDNSPTVQQSFPHVRQTVVALGRPPAVLWRGVYSHGVFCFRRFLAFVRHKPSRLFARPCQWSLSLSLSHCFCKLCSLQTSNSKMKATP